MPGSFKLLFFTSVAVISQITLAQQSADTSEKTGAPIVRPVKSTSKGDAKAAAKAPKLTPDQILANQTLEAAESRPEAWRLPCAVTA
jgi:hypothetical protein